jgi:hypothetical protein
LTSQNGGDELILTLATLANYATLALDGLNKKPKLIKGGRYINN